MTRAAQRLGITQSAMSHNLRQLRDIFGDPLLVRGKGGMQPTPRAEELVIPLRSGLQSLRRTLQGDSAFEAEKSTRRFVIACRGCGGMRCPSAGAPARVGTERRPRCGAP